MDSRKHLVILIFGALIALLIVITHVGYYDIQYSLVESAKMDLPDDNPDEKDDRSDVKVFSNDAISTTIINLNIQQGLHVIQEICLEPIENVRATVEKAIRPSQYFLTLFRRIISPNAP